jgi:hypothetical protein
MERKKPVKQQRVENGDSVCRPNVDIQKQDVS